jgi:hypothetical protein
VQRNSPDLEHRWDGMLDALRAYRAETGTSDVPREFRTEDGRGLGAWLHRQRSLFAAGRLPADRSARLTAEGVTWRVLDRQRALSALHAYLTEHDHLRVPSDYATADGLSLGTWVQSRRAEYRRDPARTLRLWPELAALPFEWQQRTDLWEQGIAALEQYRRDYGDARVPHWFETADGLRLGKWLDTRRTEYRAGALAGDRVAALEAQGVEWSLRIVTDTVAREAREDAHFAGMLAATVRWVQQHDGLVPPVREVDADGRAVGRWFARLRRLARDGEVPARRLPLVEQELPGLFPDEHP